MEPLFVDLDSLEYTGVYAKVQEPFFPKYVEICYIDVTLHGETRRSRALLDGFAYLLKIEGMQGSFAESDLFWPADVVVFPSGELGVLYGPDDYKIGKCDLSRVSFIS